MRPAIRQQVVVITGASSGIGRVTALAFGQQGARVVLAARHEAALQEVAQTIERTGGRALVVPTDVSHWPAVERLAERAVDHFGRIDTWVNNAGVSLYGTVEQSDVEEIERLIQVDLLGPIYGIKAVLPHMIRQRAGAIITVGSVLSEVAVPLQSAYVAAKHGLRGFVDSLRMELQTTAPDLQVTLIMPASIDTPFFAHARSKMGVQPQGVPPLYPPELVAEAILLAATERRRDIVVGDAGRLLITSRRLSPATVDWLFTRNNLAVRQQRTRQPDDGRDNLNGPVISDGHRPGLATASVARTSPYTRYVEFQSLSVKALAALGLAGALVWWSQRDR